MSRLVTCRWVSIAVLMLAAGELGAQEARRRETTRLVVVAVDASNGMPIRSGVASLENLGRSQPLDSLGVASFAELPAGVHTLRVRSIGYRIRVEPVQLQRGDSVEHRTRLELLTTELPTVTVRESAPRFSPGLKEFEQRRATRPFGHFVGEEELRAQHGSDLRNLAVWRLPGLRIEPLTPGSPEHVAYSKRGPNSITSKGRCRADVYLDGLRVPGGEVTRVPLSSLAGVEWYSPGTVPVRYKRMNVAEKNEDGSPACGVLLLWSAW